MKFVSLILLASLVSAAPTAAATGVWIDTDPSVARGGHEVDDGFALVQAFRSAELDVRGVSLVFGNSPLKTEIPIGRRLVNDFGPKGLRVYTGAASAQQLGTETDASRALAAALRKEKLTVLAIGPLTNVATVVRSHPELSSRIERIVAVAGRRPNQRFVTDTSAKPFRDFNFESDPAAFQVLLGAGVPLVLTPWEISSKVWIRADDLRKLRSADPSLGWVLDAAQEWLHKWTKELHTDGFNPFDTLAVGYVISPAGFGCEELPAQIKSLPDDTEAGSSKNKPYLILDKSLKSRTDVLYCSQPPPQFAQELIRRIEHTAPVSPAKAGFDYSAWNELAKKYIDSEHRVDYKALKARDLARLDTYLRQFEPTWPSDMTAAAQKAALINAYNALTVRWILANYPVESIWNTEHPFKEARHTLNAKRVSLDDIETKLRNMGDPRIHAALVCAARSCPPLRREAYTADRVNAQLDDNFREWLANPKLNEFLPNHEKAEVSMIFKWYGEDFDKAGGSLKKTLANYGPPVKAAFLLNTGAKLEYKSYDWGLNDTSDLGADYSKLNFWWDALRNKW